MESYGRTLTRQPNEYERVQSGGSVSPQLSPKKVPFAMHSTEKKKRQRENKLVHATNNATVGTHASPRKRATEPFTLQPQNMVWTNETKKIKRSAKKEKKKEDQENISDAIRTPNPKLTTFTSFSTNQGVVSAEKSQKNETKARMIIAKNAEGFQKFGAMMGKAKNNMVRS